MFPTPCNMLKPDLQLVEVVVRRRCVYARLDQAIAELIVGGHVVDSRR